MSSSTHIINPYKWFAMSGYEPTPAEKRIHDSKARFIVVDAGRRFGKTLTAAKKAECKILIPNTIGWVVSITYDHTLKVLREIYRNMVMRWKQITGYPQKLLVNKIGGSGPFKLVFPWGAVVEGKSATHPDSLIGEGLDWIVFDESAKVKAHIWEQCLRPALTDKQGEAMFISTPDGQNWFYDLWLRGQDRKNNPLWESFKFKSVDNPYLPKEDIEDARRTLSEAVFRQEYEADFTITVGQVYKRFDDVLHTKYFRDGKTIDKDWRFYRSIDFGTTNPFVCLWFAVDPSDNVYLFKEYYQTERTIPEHAAAIYKIEEQLSARFGKKLEYEWTAADPSAKGDRMQLAQLGIPTLYRTSKVRDGIELCNQRLKVQEDGSVRFNVDASECPNFIRETGLYCYPDVEDKNQKEDPEKKDDHTPDAWRYFEDRIRLGEITQGVARY